MSLKKTSFILIFLFSLGYCSLNDENDTIRIMNNQLKAWSTNNLTEIMADYSNESYMIANETLILYPQIEKIFGQGIEMISKYCSNATGSNPVVHENVFTHSWAWDCQGFVLKGTNTYMIENGKIKALITYSNVDSKHPETNATPNRREKNFRVNH